MSVVLFLAAASAPAAGAAERVAIELTVRQPCDQADDAALTNEIIVCGERERQAYNQPAPDGRTGKPAPKAEVQLAEGTVLAVETESEDLGRARTQRAMVRLKFKF